MLTFIGAIALLMILKCFVDKPEESTWPSAVAWTGAGLWLVITSPEVFSVKLGVGIVCLLRGIAHLGDLTLLPWLESRGNKQEAEEEAGSTESVPPSVATPTVTPYAVPEESPISAEEPEEHAPMSTPVAQSAPEENDEEENNSPTPPAAKPLAGKRICVTGKLPYKRRRVEDFIVAMGGEVQNRVTRHTDFVVAGEDCGAKLDEAERRGISVVSYDGLLALCGLPECDILEVMPREFRAQRIRERLSAEEAREYGKEFKRRIRLLTEVLTTSVSDILPKVVQVVSKVDDELELHRISSFRSSPRGELVLLSTEGEAIYLDDLTGDSVVRLLAAYGR